MVASVARVCALQVARVGVGAAISGSVWRRAPPVGRFGAWWRAWRGFVRCRLRGWGLGQLTGGALSKGQAKEVSKLHQKQAEAFAKQAAQLEASPGMLDTMTAALAALHAELRAVLADAPTTAVLSSELVAQLEA